MNGQFSKVNLPLGQFTSRAVGPGYHVRGQLCPVNCRGIVLSNSQYGFLPSRSASSQVLNVLNKWYI